MELSDLKKFATENKIPIISDEALAYIKNYIQQNNVKTILEIGSAIGYSAICFSAVGAKVDTFERDQVRADLANDFISKFNANVTLYQADALSYDKPLGQYDLIFIDAAKAQYQRFFTKFANNLAPGGAIICDNLNFHNLDISTVSRRTKGLIKKLAMFKEFLKNNSDYHTLILDIGDGLSVSKKV